MLKRSILILICLLSLSACEKSSESADIKTTLDEVKKTLNDLSSQTTSVANDELEKLNTFEYLVSELPLSSTTAEISEHLNKLGTDRWDCYQIFKENEYYRFFCRRMPKTYLRYLQYLPKFLGQ